MTKGNEHDDKDLESIFKEHSEKILRQIRGMIPNPDDAEDLTQEVFLRAQDALPKFRGESRLTTWLARIAANACVDAGRNATRRAKRETIELSDDQHPPVVELNLVSSLLDEEQQERLREVLRELPPDQLLLLSLRYSDQLTYREIADVMGVQEYDVINHLRTLLSRVDRMLKFKELVAERRENGSTQSDRQTALDGLVVSGKGSEQVYYNLGRLYLQKGLVEAAIREWRKAHELAPDFIEPCLAIADQYAATNRPVEAVSYLADVVRDVKSAELHTRLGESYVGIEDFTQAIYHCQQAIKLQPDYVRSYIILSKIHRRQAIHVRRRTPPTAAEPSTDPPYRKYLIKSLSNLKKAIELDPNEPITMGELVRTMLLAGDLSDTLSICGRALARFPDVQYVQYAAAQAYEAAGELDRAAELYAKSLERGENPWFRARLATTLNRSSRFAEALKQFQKLAAMGENMQYYGSVHAGIAGSHLALGRLNEAYSAARRSYESGQDPIDGRCRLSMVLALRGEDLDRALSLAEEGLSLDYHHLCFKFTLSRVHMLCGRNERALAEARAAAEYLPSSPELQAQRGCAALAGGCRDEAEAALRAALEIFPVHREAEYALKVLEAGGEFDPAKLPSSGPRPYLAYCLKVPPWI